MPRTGKVWRTYSFSFPLETAWFGPRPPIAGTPGADGKPLDGLNQPDGDGRLLLAIRLVSARKTWRQQEFRRNPQRRSSIIIHFLVHEGPPPRVHFVLNCETTRLGTLSCDDCFAFAAFPVAFACATVVARGEASFAKPRRFKATALQGHDSRPAIDGPGGRKVESQPGGPMNIAFAWDSTACSCWSKKMISSGPATSMG
jgi:hypothetical protein